MFITFDNKANILIDVHAPSVHQHTPLLDLWLFHEEYLRSVWQKCHSLHATAINDSRHSHSSMLSVEYIVSCVEILHEHSMVIPMVDVESSRVTSAGIQVSTHSVPHTVSLLHCLRYSPAKLNTILKIFVAYQLIAAVGRLHTHRMLHLGLHLDNIYLNENAVLSLGLPDWPWLLKRCQDQEKTITSVCSTNQEEDPLSATKSVHPKELPHDLMSTTLAWLRREMSNFDYLMYLNRAVGRRYGDPTHHYMMPWVTDFSVENGGWRDLTKTKYRLNKGDAHLDMQFKSQQHGEVGELSESHLSSSCPWKRPGIQERHPHPAHHISDAMCEITYYSYKARQTPKQTLCRVVRSVWRPQEYPSSMQRMFLWTPDECIPEFFTDPQLFTSVHEDMADLALPDWCKNAEDFLQYHRRLLESDAVSDTLHHWIDLTFGYKLLGVEAVEAKNVHLHLVDQHERLTETGVICLFTAPHPARFNSRVVYRMHAGDRPLLPDIALPPDQLANGDGTETSHLKNSLLQQYDPLILLEQHQTVYNFFSNSSGATKFNLSSKRYASPLRLSELLQEDCVCVACLLVEVFLFEYFVWEEHHKRDLWQRVQLCRSLLRRFGQRIPDFIRVGLETILEPECDDVQSLEDVSQLCPLSTYFPLLFTFPPFVVEVSHLWMRVLLLGQPWQQMIPEGREHMYHTGPRLDSLVVDWSDFLEDYGSKGLCDYVEPSGIPGSGGNAMSCCVRVSPVQGSVCGSGSTCMSRMSCPLEGTPMVNLVLPLFLKLLTLPQLSVSVLWHSFTPVCQMLDLQTRLQVVLPAVLRIYQQPAGPSRRGKMLKLFEKTFLKQLMMQLGLSNFLEHFSPLLVETVCGCNLWTEVLPLEDEEEPAVTLKNSCDPAPSDMSDTFTQSSSEQDDDETRDGNEEDAEVSTDTSPSPALVPVPTPEVVVHLVPPSAPSPPHIPSPISCPSLLPAENSGLVEHHYKASPEPSSNTPRHYSATFPLSSPGSGKSSSIPTVRLSSVAQDSILWLSAKLGPYITVRHLTGNMLRMLVLVYAKCRERRPSEAWETSIARADRYAASLLHCLHRVTLLYGHSLVQDQYLTFVRNCFQQVATLSPNITTSSSSDTLVPPLFGSSSTSAEVHHRLRTCEGSFLAGITLLQYLLFNELTTHNFKHMKEEEEEENVHVLPLLVPDELLMELLSSNRLTEILLLAVDTLLHPATFPLSGSQGRQELALRLVDTLCATSLRLGFELTRQHLTQVFRAFFSIFSLPLKGVPGSVEVGEEALFHHKQNTSESDSEAKSFLVTMEVGTGETQVQEAATLAEARLTKLNRLSSTSSNFSPRTSRQLSSQVSCDLMQQWEETFTPALAHRAYVRLCRLAGDIFMSNCLHNSDLVQHLVQKHEEDIANSKAISSAVSSREAVHQMRLHHLEQCSRLSDESEHRMRTLAEPWISHWQYNLGHHGSYRSHLDLKQIRLCEFEGHAGAVRSIQMLANENSFVSTGGKDRTVRLWSIASAWSDSASVPPCERYRYTRHKRPVWAAQFLPSERLVASCDSDQLHLWDPFTGQLLQRIHSFSGSPLVCMASMHESLGFPRVLVVDQNARLGVVDVRVGEVVYQTCPGAAPVSVWGGVDVTPGLESLTPVNPYDEWQASMEAAFPTMITSPGSSTSLASLLDPNVAAPEVGLGSTNPYYFARRRVATTGAATAGEDNNSITSVESSTATSVTSNTPAAPSVNNNANITSAPVAWGSVKQIHCLADGATVAWGYSTGTLSFIDLRTGGVVRAWRAHQDEISQLGTISSPGGATEWLVTASADQSLVAWDLRELHLTSGPSRHIFQGHQNDGAITAFASFGEDIVTCANHHKLGYYRALNNYTPYGRVASSIFKGAICALATLPVNRLLLLASESGRMALLY